MSVFGGCGNGAVGQDADVQTGSGFGGAGRKDLGGHACAFEAWTRFENKEVEMEEAKGGEGSEDAVPDGAAIAEGEES